MKPEQLEIARLKREVIKLKAERDILKKSRGLLREGIDVKFGFIAKRRDLAGRWLCGALGVSRGGFYAWLSDHAVGAAAAMKRSVPRFGRASLPAIRTYGARRVWHDLLAEGIPCGLHRIE